MANSGSSREYWNQRLEERGLLAMAPGDWVKLRRQQLTLQNLSPTDVRDHLASEVGNANREVITAAMSAITPVICQQKPTSPLNPLIVDVALGTGDLTASLLPAARNAGWQYLGVDQSEVAIDTTRHRLTTAGWPPNTDELRQGAVGCLSRSSGGWLEDASVNLIVWGRLGIHLADQHIWQAALEEVKLLLAPGGHFLLFETLRELNPQLDKQPRKHAQTLVRSRQEYCHALAPLTVAFEAPVEFCGEQIGIILWRK